MLKLKKIVERIYPPGASLNIAAQSNYQKLGLLLRVLTPTPKILVIGGGKSLGFGIRNLGEDNLNRMINLDIEPFSTVDVVGDGQTLPFKDCSFHAIIIQAVLEHVKNPNQVVEEIYRVVKKTGFVYAEVPFLQGYHAAPYDYQRYTTSGIVQLFSKFSKVDSGVCLGPSSALCWILKEYLAILFSFNNDLAYNILKFIFGWMTFWIKYLDMYLRKSKRANIIASGVYFIGIKEEMKGCDWHEQKRTDMHG